MRIKRNSYWVYLVDAIVTIAKVLAWTVIFLAIIATFAYLLLTHLHWF